MLNIQKNIITDENQKPIAVQIPIDDFNKIEEVIENYGLAQFIGEVQNDERLNYDEARVY